MTARRTASSVQLIARHRSGMLRHIVGADVRMAVLRIRRDGLAAIHHRRFLLTMCGLGLL